MVTVTFPLAIGNRYRDDPSMRHQLEALFERAEPESLYVGLTQRDIYMVVDTEDPARLGDIHTTLAHIAGAAPAFHPVVPGEEFARLSNALAETAASDRSEVPSPHAPDDHRH